MRLRRLAATLLTTATIAANAADPAALRRTADASQAAITAPGAQCNQGEGETFAEFIVKFTVDSEFNAKRTRMSQVFALKPIANYKALVVTQGHEAGYYQRWNMPSADEVHLVCGFADAPVDFVYIFRRQADGTWLLVDRNTPDF